MVILLKIRWNMFKTWTFIILIIIKLTITLTGQQDSVLMSIRNLSADESHMNTVNLITAKCGTDLSCMMPYIRLINDLPVDEKILNVYYFLGNHFYRKGSVNDSKTVYLAGMKKAERLNKNHPALFNYYSSLCNVYNMQKIVQADSALFYIDESEKILKANQMDVENYWKPNYNRNSVYIILRNYEKADEYLAKSYDYLKNSSNRMNKGFVLFTLLEATKKRGTTKQFKKYLDEFLLFKKSGTKQLDINHLGIMELFTDKEEAQIFLEESLRRIEKNEKPDDSADARRIKLAEIYNTKGETDKAIEQYKKVITDPVLKDRGIVFRNAYYSLYEAYKNKNQPEEAYKWIEKYIALEDSMSNETFKNQVAGYEVRYQTKEKENQLYKQELEIKNASLKSRTLLALLAILVIVFITVGYFYFKNVKFKTQMMVKDKEINEQKIRELENYNTLLSLNSVIEGQESERFRIAKDLHDGLGGLLTTIKAHFQTIQKDIQQLEQINFYNKTNKLIDEACIEVRRIAHDMVPYSIKINGLSGALEDLREGIEMRGLPCDLEIFNSENLLLNEQASNMIYRTVQEITTNAVKHAKATKLFIQLVYFHEGLNILIEDNGTGFDLTQTQTGKGIGIKSIESRVRYLGGKIHYDSTSGHGTTVNIEIPFREGMVLSKNDEI